MEEEKECLMKDEYKSDSATSSRRFSLCYHFIYILIIGILSILLMISSTKNNFLLQSNTTLLENIQRYVNKDYTFESIKDFSNDNLNMNMFKKDKEIKDKFFNSDIKVAKPLKYILVWTNVNTLPMSIFKTTRIDFINYGCEFNNCFLTHDVNQVEVKGLENFDAIVFHNQEFTAKNASNIWKFVPPTARKENQVYVFLESLPSNHNPICEDKWNSYFNWTWTYKTDSDVQWDFFVVRNKSSKEIVAPSTNVIWNPTPGVLSDMYINILKPKTKAVAWFISDVNKELDSTLKYANDLKNELVPLGLTLDIFNNICLGPACMKILKADYKFYLSFERSDAIDYATENFAKAIINFAVPIVTSVKVNYMRFAPPSSYIDAKVIPVKDVAALIKKSMDNFDDLLKFHEWRNGYVVHMAFDHHSTHPMCRLCKALNKPEMMTTKTKDKLRAWWNDGNDDKLCLA